MKWASLLLAGLFSSQFALAQPNVLFLAVDDMRDWTGCLGGYPGKVHTPHIDGLAEQGILFTNAHCPSPKCAPSRAAILTGLWPSTTGIYDNGHWWLPNLPEGAVSLPAFFRNQGYEVAGAGKIFHHTAGNQPPNQWDTFLPIRFRNDPWFRGVKRNYPWSESGPEPEGFPFSGVPGLGHENDWGDLRIPEAEYDDSLSADFALRFLEQEHEQPFFLACGLFRPHLPWYVPQTYFDLYPLDEIVLPEVLETDLEDIPEAGRKFAQARESDWNAIQKADKWKEAIQAYLASISYADAQLGRVLKALKAHPESTNTIVVLWSDHGWHLGEKGHWHKSTLWEEATRIPLIIAAPGFEPGICYRPVNLIDLYPTLLELCGLSAAHSLDGVSLLPLLEDPDLEWDRPSRIEYLRGNAAIRSERYRLIHYSDGSRELYDHSSDPKEWTNLAAEPGMQSIMEELSKWLPDSWAESKPTKGSFHFDPETFTWTHKESGRFTRGRKVKAK